MIEIDLDGTSYEIRNEIEEMTVGELEVILYYIGRDDLNVVDKWIRIFEVLGVSQHLVDNLDFDDFRDITAHFKFDCESDPIQDLNIGKIDYRLYEGDQFKLKLRDLNSIIKLLKNKTKFFLTDILCILYRAEQEETEETMLEKIEFVRSQPATLVLPILKIINRSLSKKIELELGA